MPPDAALACDDFDLHATIAALADPALDGRAPGTEGDRAARALVEARFRCLGLVPAFATGYAQPFDDTANVVGYLPGETSEIVLVGAHLDHLGHGHLGANDDASGITAMLAVADAAHRTKPRRTIVFAAFGAEELGEHGSTYFADHAPEALPIARVVYDVNLDMVGSYRSHGEVIALGDFPKQPARPILDRLARAHRGLTVVPGGRGVGSDHEAFCARGIPYIFFWTPDARCYHQTCDTLANLDEPHLVTIAALAAELVLALATTPIALADARGRLDCGGR